MLPVAMGSRRAWYSVETADERRRQGSHSSRRGSRSGFGSRKLEDRVRELERLLGRKTMEDKKTDLAVAIAKSRRFPVKTVAATLQVARSNVIERRDGSRPQRAPQNRAGDVDLVADIRRRRSMPREQCLRATRVRLR
jgi:hypothetical protein